MKPVDRKNGFQTPQLYDIFASADELSALVENELTAAATPNSGDADRIAPVTSNVSELSGGSSKIVAQDTSRQEPGTSIH